MPIDPDPTNNRPRPGSRPGPRQGEAPGRRPGHGESGGPHGPGQILLALTRVWLPLAVAVAGLVAILIGHGDANSPWAAAGVSLIIVALIVWLINWLFRMSVQSNLEREGEERARDYFEEHGRWPGE